MKYNLTCIAFIAALLLGFLDPCMSQKDIRDVLGRKDSSSKILQLQKGKLYKAFLPIVGYTPANGFLMGIGVSGSIYLGDPNTTKISSIITNLNVTAKNQVVINLRSNLYSNNNKWIYQGDTRMLFFSQETYGLGINFDNAMEEPMKFNYFRFNQSLYRKIAGSLYAGAGFALDRHYNIRDLRRLMESPPETNHSIYSSENDFSPLKYSTSGVLVGLLYDSRDNSIFTHNGQYAQVYFRMNETALGSDQNSSRLFTEYRGFLPVSRNTSKVLGFWFWQSLQTSGQQPYLSLPSITWDMYNRSGRGYIQGRIRGENFAYAESEYRFPLTKNGLLSGVAFANISTASNNSIKQKLYSEFAAGYGIGLRIKMDKRTNTNLAIDYGRGRNGSNGIYFNLQETF
jgi:outer membrane protein assembly factor BamA